MTKRCEEKKYRQFYSTVLGTKILEYETRFVVEKVQGYKNVLSIGCGPALLEERLQQLHPGMNIIGLDHSKEMIEQLSKKISIVYGDAQYLAFKDNSFDVVLYVTSLEFITNIQKTLGETNRVLKQNGVLLILMLNPNSEYFQEKYNHNTSYIRKNIKHTNINKIKNVISQYFIIKNQEYVLAIIGKEIICAEDQHFACLFVVEGKKR